MRLKTKNTTKIFSGSHGFIQQETVAKATKTNPENKQLRTSDSTQVMTA
jgi:hypothetical protein